MTETKRGKYERTEEIRMKISENMKNNDNALKHGGYVPGGLYCKKINDVAHKPEECLSCKIVEVMQNAPKLKRLDDITIKEIDEEIINETNYTNARLLASKENEIEEGKPRGITTKLQAQKLALLFKLRGLKLNYPIDKKSSLDKATTQEQPKQAE